MIKALIIKEWIKTRRMFLVMLLLTTAVTVYVLLMMSRLIELKGAGHLMLIMILKDNSFVDSCRFMPLLAAIGIAASQMVPEMSQRRLKLTLHLPCGRGLLMSVMLLSGLAELTLIFLVQTAMVAVYDSTVLPAELVARVVLTMMPWLFAGYVGYLFVTAICLEGTRTMRVILALAGIAVMFVFYQQPAMEAYDSMIVLMIVLTAAMPLLSVRSIMRFKEGLYD